MILRHTNEFCSTKMKILITSIIGLFGVVSSSGADTDKKNEVTGVEIRMSVRIYGGSSCYFGSDGSVVYQLVIPDREAGHGMIEKRYVMMDELAIDWRGITEDFNLIDILNAKRKTDVGVAGESSFTFTLHFSDGTTKDRWAFTDDPITGVWVRMTDDAWSRAAIYIPLLAPYEEENFAKLHRYIKKVEQDGAPNPNPR